MKILKTIFNTIGSVVDTTGNTINSSLDLAQDELQQLKDKRKLDYVENDVTRKNDFRTAIIESNKDALKDKARVKDALTDLVSDPDATLNKWDAEIDALLASIK